MIAILPVMHVPRFSTLLNLPFLRLHINSGSHTMPGADTLFWAHGKVGSVEAR